MNVRHALAASALWTAATTAAMAQQDITVQLPTFNFTTASTTVSVPDGGTGLLGGINRASESSVSRGVPMLGKMPVLGRLFNNRGIGRDMSASNFTVVPRIIILEEEEFLQTGVTAETLSAMQPATPSFFGGAPVDPVVAGKADFISRNIAHHDAPAMQRPVAENASPSIEQIRRANDLAAAQRVAEAREFFAKGERAEAEGKAGVAKIYYQMAGRRADGELQQTIVERLAILNGTSGGTTLAGR